MLHTIKAQVRDSLPGRLQVPAKHWYGRIRGKGEPEIALLVLLVKRGDHVVDVGGNRGAYSYPLWKLGARLEIFEPHPACNATLSDWARSKRDVHVHQVALSSTPGTATLHVPIGADGIEHSASASVEHSGTGRVANHVVKTAPLDSFGFEDLTLIKVDVEGHERAVLAGATETLARCLPALLIEIEQRHNEQPIAETFAMIASLGYHGYFLADGKLTPIERFEAGRDQSPTAFASGKGAYYNNFLFLGMKRVAESGYGPLLGTVQA